MALVHRKRINSTLSANNFDLVSKLSKDTGLNQSKIFDLAIDLLRDKLESKDILTLISEYKEDAK